ncbi:MAG: serine hydrolase domain-containing protein [Actinomycetota bacterium]|nr:serine hydrolase domain-containing protein [Actinomycetota bacterium]
MPGNDTGSLVAGCVEALCELAEQTARDEHVASISWGVVAGGELAAHGFAGALLHDDEPADLHASFRIASMTKSFTAAVVLALRDEGVWQLDDAVTQHAPELASVKGPPGSPPVTLRHLLSMAAGMATDDAWADRHLDMTEEEIDRVYAAGPTFAHLPNTAYEYSNLGYAMLGRAVVRATGTRVQQHITDRLLEPLGMHDTTWVRPDHDHWARPHRYRDGQIIRDWPTPLGDGEIAPMGGLWTTVADLARWVAWLDSANSRPPQPASIGLSAAGRREMQRVQTYIGTTTVAGRTCPAGYGLGLNLRDDATLGTVVAHAGGLPGYGSNMRWLAGREIGAIALGNSTYAPMSVMTMRMLELLHEHGAVPPVPAVQAPEWEAAAHRLVALLNDWTDSAATELFADNVALDEPLTRRREAAERLLATHGRLHVVGTRAQSATSGAIEVRGSGDAFTIDVELSPQPHAPVQYYDWP